ncbi:MAG: hypothetical protein RL660_2648 [Bacteroidota bacterium]|jgi:tetratricopeptide (TPR) repeat protein
MKHYIIILFFISACSSTLFAQTHQQVLDADSLYKLEDYNSAIQLYKASMSPTVNIWKYNLNYSVALCYYRLGNYDSAISYAKASLRINKKHKEYITTQEVGNFLLARVYSQMQKDSIAYQHYKLAVRYSINPSLLASAGHKALQLGELNAAKQWLLKAISLDSNNFIVLNNLASYYVKTNQLQEATRMVNQSIDICPTNASARLTLARLLIKKNAYEEACMQLAFAEANLAFTSCVDIRYSNEGLAEEIADLRKQYCK